MNHLEELSVFTPPLTNTGVNTRQWIEYRPTNQISGGIPVGVPDSTAVYRIHGSEEKYSENETSTRQSPRTARHQRRQRRIGQSSLTRRLSQGDCSLQQTSVTQTGTNYPYKAYIDTLLETGANDRVYSNQYY